ncbi:unnamed protein product [Medioppia subpectinata]|uniref:Uncharacterized protein n=1 Tax=Medioppia subpectinata TaxID=1979941 RepID=A0A7R9Q4G0_9ACAR|nr:unnamed protein product [Medioppia subpectinata]CAG2111421.1 unnamed protein product [Medioppia subpectinata]
MILNRQYFVTPIIRLKKLLSKVTDPFGGNPFVADQYWTPAMFCLPIGVSRVVQIMPEKCRRLLGQNGYIQEGEDSGAAGLHIGQVVDPRRDPIGFVTPLPIGAERVVMIVIITADTVFDSIVWLGITRVEASDGSDTSAYSLQHPIIPIEQPIAVRHPYIRSVIISGIRLIPLSRYLQPNVKTCCFTDSMSGLIAIEILKYLWASLEFPISCSQEDSYLIVKSCHYFGCVFQSCVLITIDAKEIALNIKQSYSSGEKIDIDWMS